MGDWKHAVAAPGWRTEKIINLIDLPIGQVDPRRRPFSDMILVAPDHIEGGSGTVVKYHTACEQKAISGKYLFAPGDVIYSKIRPYLRKAFHARFSGLCSADMYPLRPHADSVDARFLLGLLLANHFSRFAEIVSMRSGFPKINREELAEYVAAIPPLCEQRAIAAILHSLDDVIRKTEQIIAKLQQLKQGLLHALLTRGIDDNGELRDPERHPEQFQASRVGRVPSRWAITSVGEQVSATTLGTARRGASPSMADNLRLLKMGNLDWGTVDASKCELVAKQNVENWESLLLAPGDLLFNTRNTPELVGKTAAWREPSADVIPDNNIMRVRFRRVVSGTFVATYMSSVGQRAVSRMATGTTSVAAIYWRDLHRLTFPMPPRVEQDTIIERLDALDARIEAESASLAVYRQLKTGLSEDLLTGRVRATSLTEVAA